MNFLLLLSIASTIVGAVFLLVDISSIRRERQIYRRLNATLPMRPRETAYLERRVQDLRARLFKVSGEFGTLLVQAGWDSRLAFLLWFVCARMLPIVATVLVSVVLFIAGRDLASIIMAAIFTYAFFFVGANMVLRWRAADAARKIRKELVPFLHLLRMLFNAGLTLEHALVILVEESDQLFPLFGRQLRRVVADVGDGQDLAEALIQMARTLDIREVTDTMSMLYQVVRQGGNIQASLAQYIALIEEHQLAAAREYVSKLSGKMSVVMMVFMFPALIIFIAGPGFIGLSKALGGGAL